MIIFQLYVDILDTTFMPRNAFQANNGKRFNFKKLTS